MADVAPLPVNGAVIADRRDTGPAGESRARSLRVSWHGDMLVLSIWRDGVCVATSQLATRDVPPLVTALVEGLAGDAGVLRDSRRPA
jgi:hypothetical protein